MVVIPNVYSCFIAWVVGVGADSLLPPGSLPTYLSCPQLTHLHLPTPHYNEHTKPHNNTTLNNIGK